MDSQYFSESVTSPIAGRASERESDDGAFGVGCFAREGPSEDEDWIGRKSEAEAYRGNR